MTEHSKVLLYSYEVKDLAIRILAGIELSLERLWSQRISYYRENRWHDWWNKYWGDGSWIKNDELVKNQIRYLDECDYSAGPDWDFHSEEKEARDLLAAASDLKYTTARFTIPVSLSVLAIHPAEASDHVVASDFSP